MKKCFNMSTNVVFKKFEVIGETKDAAIAQSNLTLMRDASVKYNQWAKENIVTDASQKEWMKEYLRKNKLDKAGVAAYIVTQRGSKDTRKRPYEYEKIKHDAKTHTMRKGYVVRDDNNNVLKVFDKSKDQEAFAKKWVTENHANCKTYVEAIIKENNALYATCKYAPSAGTQAYKLLVFGYENAD